MITFIIVILFIVNFLFCRYADRRVRKITRNFDDIPYSLWFLPPMGMILATIALAIYTDTKFTIKNSFLRKVFNLDLKDK